MADDNDDPDVLPDFDLFDEGAKRRSRRDRKPTTFTAKVIMLVVGLAVALTPLIAVYVRFQQMFSGQK